METPITPSYQPMPTEPSVAPVPAPMPVAPTPKKSRKVLWSVVALITVLLAAYGVYAFYSDMWPFTPAEEPLVSASPSPSEIWKTHTNTATQFSFQYPGGMTVTESENEYPGDPLKRWVRMTGESAELDMFIEINNPGRGINDIADPVTGTVVADGATISYRAGRVLPMGEVTPGIEFVWQAQFQVGTNEYLVEFITSDGADRTVLVRSILSTFEFAN